jgi:hypothetical protein
MCEAVWNMRECLSAGPKKTHRLQVYVNGGTGIDPEKPSMNNDTV